MIQHFATAPGPNTVPGYMIVYVLPGIMLASALGAARWLTTLNRRINEHAAGLALILQQVMPSGQPSLRDLLDQNRLDVANIKGQIIAVHATQMQPRRPPHPGSHR